MQIDRMKSRDKKYSKKRYGMRVSNRSIFVIEGEKVKRGKRAKKEVS